jgi:predicted dehydrogenase
MNIQGSIIGSTKIVENYIEVFNYLGMNIDSIAASINSDKAKKLSKKYKINYFQSTQSLINNFNGDFLIIASKPETLLPILSKSLNLKTKILVEKPVSHSSELLAPYTKLNNVQVGFNRRFYSNIDYFKKRIDKNKFYVGEVSIPETVNLKKFTKKEHREIIFNNSIHLVDLAHYLFGNLSVKDVDYIFNKKNKISSYTFKLYNSKCSLLFRSIANQTKNTHFEIFDGSNTYNFLPLEKLEVYRDFKIENYAGTRRYIPKAVYTKDEFTDSFKPGFVKQANEFKKLVLNKKCNIPKIRDAYKSLKAIEEVHDQLKLK